MYKKPSTNILLAWLKKMNSSHALPAEVADENARAPRGAKPHLVAGNHASNQIKRSFQFVRSAVHW